MDKHSADGTLEKLVEIWNNDFMGTNAPDPDPDPSDEPNGIPTGAIVGIIIAAVAVIGCGSFIIIKKKSKK